MSRCPGNQNLTYCFANVGNATDSGVKLFVTNMLADERAALAAVVVPESACAGTQVLANGTVKCWGDNDQYQLGDNTTTDRNAPSAAAVAILNDATAITAGADHTCALRNNGQVWCWGRNSSGQVGDGTTTARSQPVASSHIAQAAGEQAVIIAISAGRLHTCALAVVRETTFMTPNSKVECWGYNGSGQLGNGTTLNSSVPVWAGGVSLVQSISANGDHSCALLANGTLKCWGDNASGQVGDGTVGVVSGAPPVYTNGIKSTPASVPGVTISGSTNSGRLASLGYQHTCVALADGTVKCWGNDWRSQLGNGSFTGALPPNPAIVAGLSAISNGPQIGAGSSHSCALLAKGTASCWGSNASGQLGNGTLVDASSAGAVLNVSNAVALCTGARHSCALLADGTAKCWGSNANGQLGTGATSGTPVSTPNLLVSGLANATGITCGISHTCASIADGTTQCWGSGAFGQTGSVGSCGSGCSLPAPVMLDDGTDTVVDLGRAVAAGDNHTCALSAAGTVTCWGNNTWGNLGDGSLTQRLGPVGVTLLNGRTAKSLALGSTHSCAMIADGTVQCWGDNTSGALGDGTTVQRTTPVNATTFAGASLVTSMASGGHFSCTRMVDSTLKCWGLNARGQLGSSSPSSASSPLAVPGLLARAATVTVGGAHTCGFFGDGSVECWGFNTSGQLGRGNWVSSYQAAVVPGFP